MARSPSITAAMWATADVLAGDVEVASVLRDEYIGLAAMRVSAVKARGE